MTKFPHPENTAEPARRSHTGLAWALALGAVYFTLLGALWIAMGSGEAARGNEWVRFFGRFHFLALHIPIGMLAAAAAIEVMCIFKGARPVRIAQTFILWFSTLGAIGATVFGYLLSQTGGYGPVLLERHLWTGIGVAGGCLLTLIVKIMYDQTRSTSLNLLYKTLLFSTVVTLFFASHFGGTLTHGEGFLTRDMPDDLKRLVGLAVAGKVEAAEGEEPAEAVPISHDELVAYYDVIVPVLEEKCWSCHQESKHKGNLRMDTFAHFMKGGDYGVPVVPGDADASELYYRLTTDDEDERMPPDGKDPMTPEEVELVKWWILSGADENKKVAELERPAEIQAILDNYLKTLTPKTMEERQAAKAELEAKAKAQEAKAENAVRVAEIASKVSEVVGVTLLPLAQGEDRLQFTAVNVTDTFGDAELAKLGPVADAMADMNLARTKVSDAGLAEIAKMRNLERLRLEKTSVSDDGIGSLAGLEKLEYLNLYGTKVTNAGIQKLAELKNLKKLFVWETGVTRDIAQQLVDKNPGLVVNLGWDNEVPGPDPDAPQPEEATEPEPEEATPAEEKPAEEKPEEEAPAEEKPEEEKPAEEKPEEEKPAEEAPDDASAGEESENPEGEEADPNP
ncbi:ribonuclease inhibitor [soil metagenome]